MCGAGEEGAAWGETVCRAGPVPVAGVVWLGARLGSRCRRVAAGRCVMYTLVAWGDVLAHDEYQQQRPHALCSRCLPAGARAASSALTAAPSSGPP